MIARLSLALCLAIPALAQTVTDDTKPAVPATDAAEATVANPLVSAQALLKKGKFEEAAAAFKAIVAKDPSSAEAQTGLVRSLLRARQLDEAEDAAAQAVAAAPSSALVHAAVGDLKFRLGKFADAEAEYRAALKLDGNSARGTFGMARMMEMVSLHKSAKAAFAKAHELDPEDEQIYAYWVDSLPLAQRLEVLKEHAGDHPSERQRERIKYVSALVEKKPWVLATEMKPSEIKMLPYGKSFADVNDINREAAMNISKGYGLQVKFNDRASAVLLLDTGAGGITIGRKLAERVGVVKIADSYFGGIGDQGPVQAYVGWVDKIRIGDVEFHNCLVHVSSKNDVTDDAGLIGADIFRKFLVTLDFANWKLMLAPLPKNPTGADDDEVAQDRYVAPEMQSFTKFYRFDHDIVVPVVVSDKAMGNFILDTGAFMNTVSAKLASQVTKATDLDYRVKGVSGTTHVKTGDKVILQFAKMRIESHDLPVLSTDGISAVEGTEIAGLIGIRTLTQMKMTIDYRDGLVNLEVYEFKKARE